LRFRDLPDDLSARHSTRSKQMGFAKAQPILRAKTILFAVNKFAIYLAPKRIDHRYFEVLIVAEALVAEVLGYFSAMPDRFGICLELDPNRIPMRDAIFHIEEKLLHCDYLWGHQSGPPGLVPGEQPAGWVEP
jgi:hypothetical protein